jgi:hypothetical protein
MWSNCAFGCDDRRVMIGQVDDGGAEGEVFGLRHEAGEKHQRRGERLGGGGEMLAHPQFVVAEPVGEQRLGGVLGQRLGKRTAGRMHRHHEQPKTHAWRLPCFLAYCSKIGRYCISADSPKGKAS